MLHMYCAIVEGAPLPHRTACLPCVRWGPCDGAAAATLPNVSTYDAKNALPGKGRSRFQFIQSRVRHLCARMCAGHLQSETPKQPGNLRYWLPGPPPRRRMKELDTVQESGAEYGQCFLVQVPIRRTDLWSYDNRHSDTLTAYFQERKNLEARALSADELYLFHGCASETSPALLESFSRYGPSIHFSRQQSYFSRSPAVYWTDSLDFAFAWCIFSETGSWTPKITPEASFQCLIYVSKVKRAVLDDVTRCYTIPDPKSEKEEEDLVRVSCSLSKTLLYNT